MAKYKPEKDLPAFAREYKTTSPAELAKIVLMKRNVERTPESITMWFKCHPDVLDDLNKELHSDLPTEKQAVEAHIFDNGAFEELPSIKKWKGVLHARELTPLYIQAKIGNLRNICRGTLHGHDFVAEGKWNMRHPDRLVYSDMIEINALLKENGIDTYMYKRELKDFLENVQDIPVGKKITVGKPKSFGKYAKLKLDKPTIQKILLDIETVNYEAYAADLFMLKTATRVSACLNASIENISKDYSYVTIFDKGRLSKYPKGHPWDKRIDPELKAVLVKIIGERKNGRIFNINKADLGTINHDTILKYAPELFAQYPDLMPNHFWRHMFAQHMLDQTDWNYAVVAALGGWTEQALEESYGQPPDELVREWREKFQLDIQVAPQVVVSP